MATLSSTGTVQTKTDTCLAGINPTRLPTVCSMHTSRRFGLQLLFGSFCRNREIGSRRTRKGHFTVSHSFKTIGDLQNGHALSS